MSTVKLTQIEPTPLNQLYELEDFTKEGILGIYDTLSFMLLNQISTDNLIKLILKYNEKENPMDLSDYEIISSIASIFDIQIDVYENGNVYIYGFAHLKDKRFRLIKKEKYFYVLASEYELTQSIGKKYKISNKLSSDAIPICSNNNKHTGPFKQFIATKLVLCYPCMHHYYVYKKMLCDVKQQLQCSNENCKLSTYYLINGRCSSCRIHYKQYKKERPIDLCSKELKLCAGNCGKTSINEFCYKCVRRTGNLFVSRTCTFCSKEEIIVLKYNTIIDNWVCCTPRSFDVYSENKCKNCNNTLVKTKEDKEICFKCYMIDLIQNELKYLITSQNTFELVYKEFMKNREINLDLENFDNIILQLNKLFDKKNCSKINYMYVSGDFKENVSFEEFLFLIEYIGFGTDERKYKHIKQAVKTRNAKQDEFGKCLIKNLNENGLIIYEYASNNARPVATWVEKFGILLQKLILNENNYNSIQGLGKISKKEKDLITFLGFLTMYKAFLGLKNGEGEIYDIDDAILLLE